MRLAFLLFYIITPALAKAEIIKVGLFHHENVSAVDVTINSGSYQVYSNDELIETITSGNKLAVSFNGSSIQLNSIKFNTNSSTKLELIAISADCELLVKPKNKSIQRKIVGHLGFWNSGRKMNVINTLDLDLYISGVIEAESGSKQNEEYYKVQAVICRTYALSNKFKHAKNGFHLCDDVHCQVYKGISESNPDIITATLATSDVVVVDQDINLITTAFHSNCGGRTINSEDVWSKSVPYLKAVPDTFCLDMPHSTWQKEVPKVHWMGFLNKNGTAKLHSDSLNFDHTQTHVNPKIHLKDVRSNFDLKSTYFHIEEDDQTMKFVGRGFGHGVGLCQEGAMKMSTLNYSYIEILHHYFTDIHVVPLSNFHLFSED